MKRRISIGNQSFQDIIENGDYYVDKTLFIKEWYENRDIITLITRPRRFGKTLTLDMVKCFFSNRYAGRKDLFDHLKISEYPDMMDLQGKYPVIMISFAGIKEDTYEGFLLSISDVIRKLYREYFYLHNEEAVSKTNKIYMESIIAEKNDSMTNIIPLEENTIKNSLNRLCEILEQFYKKKTFIFLDEYDTPLQEAYLHGYWNKAVVFFRGLFNATFKTNTFLSRAIMTGITRISKESIFSDLNNLAICSVTSDFYADTFGFTEEEVVESLEEYHLSSSLESVRDWYDGFVFGNHAHIYNPWSIINYLKLKDFRNYWANTSSNALVSSLVREGNNEIKMQFENLIKGKRLLCSIDEEIIFDQLETRKNAVWSLLLSTGYLKVIAEKEGCFSLMLTNKEIENTFEDMVINWFSQTGTAYDGFIKHLLEGNTDEMNDYLQSVSLSVFNSFDSAKDESQKKPENFYHGLVLGMIVKLQGRYALHSNGESGFGRYDITLEPLNDSDPAIIIEFKVFNSRYEKTLEDTVQRALKQIEDNHYDQILLDKKIPKEKIKKYGFGFRGKHVLIGKG